MVRFHRSGWGWINRPFCKDLLSCGINLWYLFTSMSNAICGTCQKPKATRQCGLCESPLCKACSVLPEDLTLVAEPPPELRHSFYCAACFDQVVEPLLGRYREILERAREVYVFTKDQSKETRLIKRKEAPLKVAECEDYDETLMRLAYLAAEAGFNALVDVDISSRKIRDGSYQSTLYSGTAIPVQIDPRRYDRPDISNPN